MFRVKFKIKNEYNRYLDIILNHIDSNYYKWVVSEDEVYKRDTNFLFNNSCYMNAEFKKLISIEDYYLVFLNLQLYDKNDIVNDIKSYEDFANSKCKLIMFVTDNEFVDIYIRDEDLARNLIDNISSNNFLDIEVSTDLDNVKQNFSAYSD